MTLTLTDDFRFVKKRLVCFEFRVSVNIDNDYEFSFRNGIYLFFALLIKLDFKNIQKKFERSCLKTSESCPERKVLASA